MATNSTRLNKQLTISLVIFFLAGLFHALADPLRGFSTSITTMIYICILIIWHRSLQNRILDGDTAKNLYIAFRAIILWMIFRVEVFELYMPGNSGNGIRSYILLAVLLSLLLISVAIMWIGCHNPDTKRKIYIPLAAFVFGSLICILKDVHHMYDIQDSFAFTFAITIEACVRIGLIQTNTDYDKFFFAANIPAIITNKSGEVKYTTEAGKDFDFDFPPATQEIRSSQITGGNAIWAQDVSELAALNEKLSEVRSQLSEEHSLLQAENVLINRNSRVESQTKIYENLSTFVAPNLGKIMAQINIAAHTDSKKPLALACVYTSYVKRRSNLMLIMSDNDLLHSSELANCLNESVDSLKLLGVQASLAGHFEGLSERSQILMAYDAFEHIVEQTLDAVEFMMVSLSTEVGIHKITIMMSGDRIENKTSGRNDYIYYFDEDDATHYFNISFRKEAE